MRRGIPAVKTDMTNRSVLPLLLMGARNVFGCQVVQLVCVKMRLSMINAPITFQVAHVRVEAVAGGIVIAMSVRVEMGEVQGVEMDA